MLRGYELYLVEQWACSRQSPTLVVTTYTGDDKHEIKVGVLSVPLDESLWSTRLRAYFKSAHQFHARPKDTDLGELMVTNLSNFPSALTVIPVPDGNVSSHRQIFVVNEDLKRLGCSGRAGLALSEPTEATQAKFQQLYRTSDRIPFSSSVTELIRLCQVALCIFEKLAHEYVDGLLCDVTETAIGNWWTEIGAEHYNYEPTDGILGPSTVAALLGMLLGARNRLHWYGAPVSKDVFEIDSTKRGISDFQRSQKLEKTRRLDRQTLFRLHTATAKAAAGETWGVQRAVKSTMTEIGGKRGEIVMDMVSGKDKGGLADIETLDIDRFITLAYGERPKWLWFGKARRAPTDFSDNEQELANAYPTKEDAFIAQAKRVQSAPLEAEMKQRQKDEPNGLHLVPSITPSMTIADSPEKEALRKAVFKSVAGKMSDARSGLGRIKDAVGVTRKGHSRGPSLITRDDVVEDPFSNPGIHRAGNHATTSSDPAMLGRAFSWKSKPEEYLAAIKRGDSHMTEEILHGVGGSRDPSSSTEGSNSRKQRGQQGGEPGEAARDAVASSIDNKGNQATAARGFDGAEPTDEDEAPSDIEQGLLPSQLPVLDRRHSTGDFGYTREHVLNESRWPRRMSFGDAEDAVLTWEEIVDVTTNDDSNTIDAVATAQYIDHLKAGVDGIVYGMEPWVEGKLKLMNELNERYGHDKEDIGAVYHQLSEACNRVRFQADELLADERAQLTENVKEIEVFVARLDYEINTLVQKVQDVEDGVENFQRQVEEIERRAGALKTQLETEGWVHWFVRTLTGVGTGPNITRSRKGGR